MSTARGYTLYQLIYMTRINLRDYYPFFKSDFFVEVTDEIVELKIAARHAESYASDRGKRAGRRGSVRCC